MKPSDLIVTRWGARFMGRTFPCSLGRGGIVPARAKREGDEVLIADLDLDQRRDWLDLFPFLATRRPDTYDLLTKPVVNPRTDNGDGVDGGIAGVNY